MSVNNPRTSEARLNDPMSIHNLVHSTPSRTSPPPSVAAGGSNLTRRRSTNSASPIQHELHQKRRRSSGENGASHTRLGLSASALQAALNSIWTLMGSTSLAHAWTLSISTPLEYARKYSAVTPTAHGDTKRAMEEEEVIQREGEVVQHLKELEGRLSHIGRMSTEQALFVRGIVPPFEQIVAEIEIPNDALPTVSWFKGAVAKYLANTFHNAQLPAGRLVLEKIMSKFEYLKSNHIRTYNSETPEPDWVDVFSDFDEACDEWCKFFDNTDRNSQVRGLILRFLDHSANTLGCVVREGVVEPRYWHFWIPTGTFRDYISGQFVAQIRAQAVQRASQPHPGSSYSLSHRDSTYSHRQRTIYGF